MGYCLRWFVMVFDGALMRLCCPGLFLVLVGMRLACISAGLVCADMCFGWMFLFLVGLGCGGVQS